MNTEFNKPVISVVIPTKDRVKDLKTCLDSLVGQAFKNFEVIVVDGGSGGDTLNLTKQYKDKLKITYVRQTGGLIKQSNAGWKLSNGFIMTRTDDDAVFDPYWLENVVFTFKDDKIGGVTGPTIMPKEYREGRDLIYFNEKLAKDKGLLGLLFRKIYYGYFMENQPFGVSRFFKSGAFSLGSNYESCLSLSEIIDADHLEACNSSYRKELVDRVGGFDERFGGIGEYHEPDLAYRVKNLGYRLVFNPKAIVYHRPSVIGVFKARPDAYSRSLNFMLFYFRHIKPNTLDKLIRFISYLVFLDTYWFFKFFVTGDVRLLGGIIGIFAGIVKYCKEI
ncbi:MAG: glycosyltransferase [Candidatus Omnitrophota bacterium]